ncbi:MAG: 50S ribosomal protein L11 methyltransferase [Proteobacteria bacterium]|nr:50S ribosomal protein L11 methyltransferase [Pseudomonadota bacterium]
MTSRKEFTEIVVIVPWQASDAVENFFMEQGALGAAVEKLDIGGETETVRAYFPADKAPDHLKRSLWVYLESIENYFTSTTKWHASIRSISEEDWEDRWKAFFRPVRVTRRIVVKPTWQTYDAGENDMVLEIDPGMAFGTGLHVTTQLCLQMIDREIGRRMEGGKVPSLLDVGTGSGILAIAAGRLGARPVLGIDIDDRAIEAARRNVKKNGVEQMVRIISGSLDAVGGTFDFVLANIDLKTVTELKGKLTGHVSPGGQLVLSGILAKQKSLVRRLFTAQRFSLIDEKNREGWSCVVFEKSRRRREH